MSNRVNDPEKAKELLGQMLEKGHYVTFFFSLFYLYPVLTKVVFSDPKWRVGTLLSFLLTSIAVVGLLLLLDLEFRSVIVFIPTVLIMGFLFISFVVYLVRYPPGE